MDIENLRLTLGSRLKENVVIRDYVTTKVGGIVDYLVVCDSVAALMETVTLARLTNVPHVVIGQGSNVLFSDIGFPGLVIVNRTNGISFISDKSQVLIDSGVLLSRLIMEVASRDLTGLEFLFGLRGSAGGAIVNNRQANGVSIGKYVKGLTMLMPDGKITHYNGSWMDFEPFSSRLMRIRAKDPHAVLPVILTITLQLSRNKKEEILRKIQHFGSLNRQLWPLEEPSIGPVFRDPLPEQPAEAFLQGIKVKKVKVGRARIFSRQPNFILTHERGLGAGTTADIHELVQQMKATVAEEYSQRLVEAFEYLGTWTQIESDEEESLIEIE
jgi:UDP-N-acetylmuramate dehydrogenase